MRTTEQTGRLQTLVNWLWAFEPTEDKKFYMGTYRQTSGCGTVACALGWCPEAFPESAWEYIHQLMYGAKTPSIGAEVFFGINYDESPFDEDYWDDEGLSEVTARDVALAMIKEYNLENPELKILSSYDDRNNTRHNHTRHRSRRVPTYALH